MSAQSTTLPRLRVSENRRFLVTEMGAPFFWLGDTAWQLFHRLTLAEADRYLANRAAKGFTVVQAVLLAELDGLGTPNANGDVPLLDNDPLQPNEAYFRHVDAIVDRAAELGLYFGMLPTWGDKWQVRHGKGPQIFSPQNAFAYGQMVGQRYKDSPLVWILGGDRNIENDQESAIIEAMAHGLRAGDGGNHLITFHPLGPGRSSDFFHQADWLDFNMNQSSHAARDHDNGLFIDHDYRLEPVKPTLDGEPRYEALVVGFYNANATRHYRFDDYDVRQAAYWALLAGACGHTYGNGNIWQMWQPGRQPVLHPNAPWTEALDHPGAFQMGYARRLFESRPFLKLAPDQAMIVDGPANGGAKTRAACAADGSFAFVYSPRGEQFSVRMERIRSRRVTASWYDPRYGTAEFLHTSDNTGEQTFLPPTRGRGCDWVLVLDDANQGFAAPGRA